MNLLQNVSLAQHSTMRLGGIAAYACEIHNSDELREAVTWASERDVPVMMIGDGSNIVWRDEGFNGLLLFNKIMGFEIVAKDELNFDVTIGSGENWDSVVDRTVQAGTTGIEALSLIPGTAGATPIQNVGAYGQEIADTLVSVEAYDSKTGEFVNIPAVDCEFGYRTSRFKTSDRGRFFITRLKLRLLKQKPQPPFYGSVQQYFDEHAIMDVTPRLLRQAVIDIRSHKLPDPAVVANNGSFFANPVISKDALSQLQATYGEVPHWPTKDGSGVKIPAAWLIERAGFKDYHDDATGMATWPTQPLVLINEHAASTSDLLKFKQNIVDTVKVKFNITLTQEPELLP